MSRVLFELRSTADRGRALRAIATAPVGARVEIKSSKRSLPQNDLFWALLTDIAEQLDWHGQRLRPEDWRYLFLDALKKERRMMPNLDNDGFVELGRSSSDLSVEEMSDLIELIRSFAAKHGVQFKNEPPQAEPRQ